MTSTLASVTTSNASDVPHDLHDFHELLPGFLPSTSYALAYSVPLVLVSLVLTFAGAFLTLDRTRYFSPHHLTGPPPKARSCLARFAPHLGGGLGGVAIGYAFGAQLVTFLALLIPNVSNSPPLSPKAFLAVVFLFSLLFSVPAGKWKYAALVFAGILGFASISLSLSVIIHPSLLTRIVLPAVLVPVGTVLCVIPLPKYSNVPVRIALSAAGSFGTILCIALLANIPAWGNVWSRLWVSNHIDWGTSKEKGLSAGICLLFTVGTVCDWLLHRFVGENPDERWDRCLAEYSDHLPDDKTRAGTFEPLRSIWDRLLNNRPSHMVLAKDDTVIPDLDAKPPMTLLPPSRRASWHSRRSSHHDLSDSRVPPNFLEKALKHPFPSRKFKNERPKSRLAPLRSDSATLIGSETKSSIANSDIRDTISNDSDSSSLQGDRESIRAAHHQLPSWTQFWHDVRAKDNDPLYDTSDYWRS